MALVVGRYKIERMDKLNLRAYEYRVSEPTGRSSGPREPRWMAVEAYFANPGTALLWLYDRLVSDALGGRDMDAAGMVRECMRIRDEVLQAADGGGNGCA